MKGQAALGWLGPDPEEIIVTNRTASAVAIGDVELLDTIRSDPDSTTNLVGVATGGVGNIVVPLYDPTTHPHTLSAGIYGVVMQAAADNFKCRFRLRGHIEAVRCSAAVVLLTSVGIAGDGTEMAVIVDVHYVIDGNASLAITRKVIFLPLTAIGATGLTDGFFDGINGLGCILSATDVT